MNNLQASIKPGVGLVYDDGRDGHCSVQAEVLEPNAERMIVQFQDRADVTVIRYRDRCQDSGVNQFWQCADASPPDSDKGVAYRLRFESESDLSRARDSCDATAVEAPRRLHLCFWLIVLAFKLLPYPRFPEFRSELPGGLASSSVTGLTLMGDAIAAPPRFTGIFRSSASWRPKSTRRPRPPRRRARTPRSPPSFRRCRCRKQTQPKHRRNCRRKRRPRWINH